MPILTETPASSAPPSGAAGGDLAGTYPNPTIGAGKVVAADIAAGAAASNVGTVGGDLTGTLPNPTVAGTRVIAPQAVAPVGLTGAVAASRYVGATASGAPASGTFAVGDFVLDQSGQVWICVAAGTPGTWRCATKDRTGLALAARGFVAEAFPLLNAAGHTIPTTGNTTGTLVLTLIGLRAGDVVTSIVVCKRTAGSGVTLAKMGLFSTAGTLLAVTGDNSAALNTATTRFEAWALSPNPYTVTADGGYYLGFLQLGSGATGADLLIGTAQTGTTVALGAAALAYAAVATQSDISGNVSPAATTAGVWWFGVS